MKKHPVMVGIVIAMAAFLPLQSCIGSFALTNKVISWNQQVGSKFINELVFFAFWILPVYEVTGIADLIVLNSIEFWSGNNPVEANVKVVETDHGNYYIACDGKGYDITSPDGSVIRLSFDDDDSTWSVVTSDGEVVPFMTMIDDYHVKMVTPEGNFRMVELTQEGLQAYREMTTPLLRAGI